MAKMSKPKQSERPYIPNGAKRSPGRTPNPNKAHDYEGVPGATRKGFPGEKFPGASLRGHTRLQTGRA